jgi:LysM repeat protein
VGASGRVQVILYTSYSGFSTYFMTASWDDAVLTVVDPGSGVAGATSAPPTSPPVVKLPPFVLPTALPDGSVVYIVQSGDSLWRIAANTGKTIDEIKAMNGLTSNVLTAGQRIIIGQGPTATPAPTIAPTEDLQALSDTASAPATAESPSPTAPPAGTTEICALLYEDINGNGQQEANEAAIPGGQLAILDANTGAPLQAYTTKPEDTNGHCFQDLPPGSYTVAATAPAGYNPTTATSVLQQADAGLHYKLQFGAQRGSRAVSGAGSKSNLRMALFGAAGVVFLLLAAGIAGFLMLRRR